MRGFAIAFSLLFLAVFSTGSFRCLAADPRIMLGGDPKLAKPGTEAAIAAWVSKIAPYLDHFALPDSFTVELSHDDSDNGSGPLRRIHYGHPRISTTLDPIFTHEFGHMIFGGPANLDRVLPLGSPDLRTRAQALWDEIESLNTELGHGWPFDMSACHTSGQYSPDCVSRLMDDEQACVVKDPELRKACERRHDAKRDWAVLHNQIPGGDGSDAFPYEEFLGDLLAVFAVGDGRAMFTALKASYGDENWDRDFTETGVAKEPSKDTHSYFFELRRLLWERFEAEGKSLESAQTLLNIAYEAMGSELARLRAAKSTYETVPKPEIEEAYLAEIKRRLGQ